MRTFLLPFLVTPVLLAGVLGVAPAAAQTREPTVAGRLALMLALRDARLACAGETGEAWRRCVERESADGAVAAERASEAPLYAGPNEVREAMSQSLHALQAAFADCRARGIAKGTPRWEFCNIERGIARLEEAAR